MGNNRNDIREMSGRFGKLVVVGFGGFKPNGQTRCAAWECLCDCGNTVIVSGSLLRRGKTQSCGCARPQSVRLAVTTHGDCTNGHQSKEYRAYRAMLKRCFDRNAKGYEYYGGRGIGVCARWLGQGGFEGFLSDMGRAPGPDFSIDRYPDNDGHYEPGNCRWATRKQQANNKRPRTFSKEIDHERTRQDQA